jgi:DNA (cytosine-5)-methyltransferase 1
MKRAYYNEFDPHAAAWLRTLIAAGHIAPGDVDERSITDVKPDDLRGYTQCHFFAGIGGWSLALRLAGIPDDRPVWTGSCPCQPFSAAGKQRGSDDERHLWPAFFNLIRQCRPASVFGEQVAGAAGLAWLDHVAADLEDAGYAAAAANLGAHSVGAPHLRQRLYWVAHAERAQRWPVNVHGEDGRDRQDARRTEARSAVGACSEVCSLADTAVACDRREEEAADHGGPQAIGPADRVGGCGCASCDLADTAPGGQRIDGSAPREARHAAQCNAACTLGHAAEPRLQGGDEPGQRVDAQRPAAERASPLDAWADIEWLQCSDGKARPTQRGLFPLASGLPKSVVRGGDKSMAPDADQSAEARVMRLRGYGNAIVPQVAAAFVMAAMP